MIAMSYWQYCIMLTIIMFVGLVMCTLAIFLGEFAMELGRHCAWLISRKRKNNHKRCKENVKSNDSDVRSASLQVKCRK